MDGVLLYGAQKSDKIDKWLKADNAPIAELEKNSKKNKVRTPLTTNNIMIVLMVALVLTGLGHFS
jgi:capsular polysaccharide biosynthesis protein